MMASTESGKGGETEDPLGGKQNNAAGEKYRMGGSDTEESEADSAKCSREETEELASEGEAKTTGGEGGGRNNANANGRWTGGKWHCSIPCSLDITRGSSLVVNHCTSDVQVTSDKPGTP